MTVYRTPPGDYIQLTLTGGASKIAFLEDKVNEIKLFYATDAEIVPYTVTNSKGVAAGQYRFRVSSNRLRPVYNLLYPRKRREISQTLLEMLGGHAAGWLWAAGATNYPDGSSCLGKVGHSEEEAQLISDWLKMLTGAESTISDALPGSSRQSLSPLLSFHPSDGAKIRQALLPYAPDSRRHLFGERISDSIAIRSARTELLHREREDVPPWVKEEAMA